MVSRRIVAAACMALASMMTVEAVHVTVFRNGESTGGVPTNLSADHVSSGAALAQYLSTLVPVDGVYLDDTKTTTDTVGDRVFTGTGVEVASLDDIQENDRLYVVGRGLHFVWPFVEFGHRVSIESTQSPTGKPITLESFNESPRVFLVHDFFSPVEADGLIDRILSIDNEQNKLQRSGVGPRQNGKKVHSPVRTSENAFDSESAIAQTINKRAFDLLRMGEFQGVACAGEGSQGWFFVVAPMSDGLQLLRYKQKQAYIPHHDYFAEGATKDWNWNPKSGGSNRFATVFLYLSNVTRGGQTVFPLANMPPGVAHSTPPTDEEMELFDKGTWEYQMVKQCYSKLASYPRKAHAVLFYSQKGNGELDPMSEHGGCPVLEGTKWGANLWVWNKRRHGLDTQKLSMDFANNLDVHVDLYWSTTFMAQLPPHSTKNYQTYDDHEWTFKDPEGNVLLVHRAKLKAGNKQVVAVPAQADTTETSPKDEL